MFIYDKKNLKFIEGDYVNYINNSDYIVTDKMFANPVEDNITGEIREATKEELCKLGIYIFREGEKFEDGKLIVVDKPADLYYPIWNNELKIWEEGADRTQLIKDRTQKILAYKKLKDEIETLELFTEFEAPEGIADLKNQLTKLKQEINGLLVVINKLK